MTGAAVAECPGPLTLFQYANGHLDRTQSDRIAAHVLTCKRCEEKVQQTGNDGRSLADALEPREPMALETAEDVLRRLDLDLEFHDDAELLEEAPRPRVPTPVPAGRLPQPPGLRVKGPRASGGPPPVRRPTPMAGRSVPPSAPPPRGFASPSAPPARSFGNELTGGTRVGPAPTAPSSAPPPAPSATPSTITPSSMPPPPSSARAPASSPPPAPKPSAAPPVPVVRTTKGASASASSSSSSTAAVVDAGGSRKWLFASIVVFALLGVGAAGALILYPRLTGEDLRLATITGAFGGDAEEATATPAKEDAKKVDDAETKDGDAEKKADADAAPADAAPANAAPADAAPANAVPAEGAPADAAPANAAPADAKAEAEVPADAKAEADAPADAKAEAEVPAEAKAEAEAPADAKAEAEVPADAPANDDATPSEATPAPAPDAEDTPAPAEPAAKPTPAAAPTDAAPKRVLGRSLPRYSEPIASRDPAEARDLARLGATSLRKSAFSEAEAYFLRALSHDPRNAAALGGLAALHFGQGRHRTALKYAAKAVSAAPQDADLRLLLGDAYFETHAFANARREYEKAAALGSDNAAARLARLAERVASN